MDGRVEDAGATSGENSGDALSAAAVALSSKVFGVAVPVAVGAPKLVGVGEYVRASEVEVMKEAFAVWLWRATTVLIPRAVGVGE